MLSIIFQQCRKNRHVNTESQTTAFIAKSNPNVCKLQCSKLFSALLKTRGAGQWNENKTSRRVQRRVFFLKFNFFRSHCHAAKDGGHVSRVFTKKNNNKVAQWNSQEKRALCECSQIMPRLINRYTTTAKNAVPRRPVNPYPVSVSL